MMRFSILLILGLTLISIVAIAEAQPPDDLFGNEHYFIVGHVYEPYTQNNEVILINTRTGESLKVTARDGKDDLKEYLFNLANLHQGWTYKDEFILSYGNITTQFSIIEGSVAYQQDIQRPDDVDPIYIFSGFLLVTIGGGYFYMKKKKSNQEAITMEEEPTEPVIDTRSIVDKVFGGTKKALIIILTLSVIAAYLMGRDVPAPIFDLLYGIYMLYFGAGGVKLGMNLTK